METQTVALPFETVCDDAPFLCCGTVSTDLTCSTRCVQISSLAPSHFFSDGSQERSPKRPVPASVILDGLRSVRNSDGPQAVLIDIRTCDLTLSQVMEAVRLFAFALPRHEIFMDGDAYAIVARTRTNAYIPKGALN